MRKIAIVAVALSATLGVAGAFSLMQAPARGFAAPLAAQTTTTKALQFEPAPYPPQQPAAQEIVAPPVQIVSSPPRHAGVARKVDVLTKCGDWQDLIQGPATSKVRRCN
jgi:hypothetical protein